ncbi:MAG: DNA replication and repair protein RecF, partial [Pseudomonadota bacterium]
QPQFLVRGELTGRTSGTRHSVAVQRNLAGELVMRRQGETLRSAAALADSLPILVINAHSFELLNGEPDNRRRFLDWGLFHVEHSHRASRRSFQRALSQRNQLLRRGNISSIELESWTHDFASHGEAVALARQQFLDRLAKPFSNLIDALVPELRDVSLNYRQGWAGQTSLQEALNNSADADVERGFTHIGPQRADVRVMVAGRSAAETLSRGQQKLVVCALKLAQGQVLNQASGRRALWLIDDLPSELDADKTARVCMALSEQDSQSMITCVDRGSIDSQAFGGGAGCSVFHVEHGCVTAAV